MPIFIGGSNTAASTAETARAGPPQPNANAPQPGGGGSSIPFPSPVDPPRPGPAGPKVEGVDDLIT